MICLLFGGLYFLSMLPDDYIFSLGCLPLVSGYSERYETGNKRMSHCHLKRFPLDSALLRIGGAAVDVPGATLLLPLTDDP